MPHECTSCGRTFPDGSKQMLEGCPDCGGKKFQFRPEGRAPSDADGPAGEDAAQASARSEVASEAELAAGGWPDEDAGGETDAATGTDATAVGSAPDAEEGGKWGTEAEGLDRPPTPERPNLEELREELNEQFESIKIVKPGHYELNLMELYDRGEYIIALEEDGKYVIDVPDARRDEP